ncbi:MAG: GIY-YIG nuclease family protein [Rhodospirillales bacterium]|nr:GIY-YIG nuclease family protein [Rhodospirillales bacterium]
MIFKDVGTLIPVWNIYRVDPGYIYMFESNGRYKIGKTKSTKDRLKAAKTWLPDLTLIGFKPFWGVLYHERLLHTGFANYWYFGEWFNFEGDDDARDLLLEGFVAFSDDNPDTNSINFIYWYNGEGMVEFQVAMHDQKLTLPKFQNQESAGQKKPS